MSCDLVDQISQLIHCILRKCPDAENRKKIQKILKEGRKARKGSAVAQATTHASASVNDNADSICWFCHADVSNLANNKCAGCRKVKNTSVIFTHLLKDIIFSCFRRATATKDAREPTGNDMEVIASRCRRRSGRRLRQRRWNMKGVEMRNWKVGKKYFLLQALCQNS